MAVKKRLRRADSFFGIHFDFHAQARGEAPVELKASFPLASVHPVPEPLVPGIPPVAPYSHRLPV